MSGGDGGLLVAPVPRTSLLLQQAMRVHLHEGSHRAVPAREAAGTSEDGCGSVAQEAEVKCGGRPDDGRAQCW